MNKTIDLTKFRLWAIPVIALSLAMPASADNCPGNEVTVTAPPAAVSAENTPLPLKVMGEFTGQPAPCFKSISVNHLNDALAKGPQKAVEAKAKATNQLSSENRQVVKTPPVLSERKNKVNVPSAKTSGDIDLKTNIKRTTPEKPMDLTNSNDIKEDLKRHQNTLNSVEKKTAVTNTVNSNEKTLLINMHQAVKMAADRSPDLAAYRARYEQSKWSTEEQRTGGNPTVDFKATYTHTLSEASADFNGNKITVGYQHNYNVALVLNQAIATFGRLHYSVLASQLAERAALEEYRQHLEAQLVSTAQKFINCLLADEEVVITTQQLEARRASLKEAESLFEGGTVAKFDVLRVRSEATKAELALIEALNASKITRARLCSDIGVPQGTPIELAPLELSQVPEDIASSTDFAASVERAMSLRPELKALMWAKESAQAKLNLVRSTRNPTLGLQSQVYTTKGGSMGSDLSWVTGIVLQVPVYDAGVEKSQAEQLSYAIKEIQANIEQAERSVKLDVENCYLNLSSRWERIQQAKVGLEQASEACRVAEVRYAAGLSTSTELLDSQTSLVQAKQALAVAKFSYLSANIDWLRAISGSFPYDVPGPMEERYRHKDDQKYWYFSPEDIIDSETNPEMAPIESKDAEEK